MKTYNIVISVVFLISLTILIVFMVGFNNSNILSRAGHYPDWMSKLPRDTKLKDIVFPGTHDSLTYTGVNLKIKYEKPNNIAKIIQKFPFIPYIPGLEHKVNRWAQTQTSSIYSQLSHGIRCFDIRVVKEVGTDKCYGWHSFVVEEFDTFLDDIEAFTNLYPSEVIIIRFSCVNCDVTQTFCNNRMMKRLNTYMVKKEDGVSPFTYALRDLGEKRRLIIDKSGADIVGWEDYCFTDLVHHPWEKIFNVTKKEKQQLHSLQEYSSTDSKIYNLDWTLTPFDNDTILGLSNIMKVSKNFNKRLPVFLQKLSQSNIQKIGVISIDVEDSVDLYQIIQSYIVSRKNN
jgi:hypothetical protein